MLTNDLAGNMRQAPVFTMWRVMGLADIARLVIGCHSTQETGVQMRVDDVADSLCLYIARHVIGRQ
jgi:hypothetical protein